MPRKKSDKNDLRAKNGGNRIKVNPASHRPLKYGEATELRRLPVSMLKDIDAELERREAAVTASRNDITSI